MKILFWSAFFIIFYAYIGFPVTLLVLSLFKKQAPLPREEYYPAVSMIIPVHNEELIIEEKIKNSLSLDYPAGRFQIIVASDNSTDKTDAIVSGYQNTAKNIEFFSCGARGGKLSVMKKAVERATGEILVFTDADAVLEKDAVKNIVMPFSGSSIGAVSANVRYFIPALQLKGRDFYWGIENFIRLFQARLDSLCMVTGPFWAVRKYLFYRDAPLYAIDDAVLPMYVVKRGYKVVVCVNARAKVLAHPTIAADFMGIKRVANGGFRAVIHHRQLLNFLHYPITAYCLLWHKIMRWPTIMFLVVLFLTNSALFNSGAYFYRVLFLLQSVFYFAAALGLAAPVFRRYVFFQIPIYLVSNWTAIFIGFFEVILGRKVLSWHSPRSV